MSHKCSVIHRLEIKMRKKKSRYSEAKKGTGLEIRNKVSFKVLEVFSWRKESTFLLSSTT